MAACGMVSSNTSSYGIHQASLIRIPSTSGLAPADLAPLSPTAALCNGTMGSTSSLLADSGYRGGSSHYSDTTHSSNSNSSVFEEPSSLSLNEDLESVGPPKLTPISGKLEKTKEKKLIKPIAVRFASPNTSPTDAYSKHNSSQSPALSDTMATYAHPPDILMTSQNHSHGFSGGKHFGRPPTKAMSLQDITPVHQHLFRINGHSGNGHHQSTLPHNHNKESSSSHRSLMQQKLHQAQSLNFLNNRTNGGWTNNNNNYHGNNNNKPSSSNNGRNRSQSQTTYPNDQRPQQSTAMSGRQNGHTGNNHHGSSQRSHSDKENVYVPVSSVSTSSIRDESDVAEENRILRNKVQDMKHQLVTMRDTMEVNEQTIFQVHQEKRRDYEANISHLQGQLQQEKDGNQSQTRAQQQEIYKLEQDRKHLRTRLEEMQKELLRVKEQGKKFDEQKTVLAESQQEVANKRHDVKRLEDTVKRTNDELQLERDNVKRLQVELDKVRLQLSKRTHATDQQHILSKKEAELSQVRADGKKAADQRDSLMLRVKKQGEEIDRLGVLLKVKEQETAQERCEVAYLKEVNERMSAALKEREKVVIATKSGVEGSSVGNASGSRTDVIELELGRTIEKLQQLQTEKDMESTRLQKRIAEKESEIKRLQSRVRDRGRAVDRNSVADQKVSPSVRRLEQDKVDLQARLGKKEQELKQAKNQVTMLQSQGRHTGPALSNSILQKKEGELKSCQEKLHQRNAEITYIRDKLGERDAELTALKVKLDRVQRQHPESGRRAGSLDRELSGTRAAKHQLEAQVKSLREENSRLKERLNKVALGVKTLSESHMNLAKMSMVPSVPDRPKFERTDPKLAGQLQKELTDLKAEMACLKEDRDQQLAEFRQEYAVWQEEKQRVIAYQKQLQLNYMQMCQKNKKLEQEIQQLTAELDTEEVIQC